MWHNRSHACDDILHVNPYIGSVSGIIAAPCLTACPQYNTIGVTQTVIMSVTPSSRKLNNRRGRSRGRDNAIGVTYDNMTALSDVHPNPLTRMTDDALDDAIIAQEQLCMTRAGDVQRARTVLTAMLVERCSRDADHCADTGSIDNPSRSNSPPSVADLTPAKVPKRATRSPRLPTVSPPKHHVNRAGNSCDDMMVDHCPAQDGWLTRWKIRGGLKVDVPVEQINAHDVTDLRANVMISNWPFNWCEHKMLTMISTLDGQLPVGKPIISAVVFTERRHGGFGGQIMLRMGNASLAKAVIRVFNGKMTFNSLSPLKAVQMHTPV